MLILIAIKNTMQFTVIQSKNYESKTVWCVRCFFLVKFIGDVGSVGDFGEVWILNMTSTSKFKGCKIFVCESLVKIVVVGDLGEFQIPEFTLLPDMRLWRMAAV
jgi:hypothetical protein